MAFSRWSANNSFSRHAPVACTIVLLAIGFAAGTLQAQESSSTWVDVDGAPLPFGSDAEISEFLRTARVVDSEKIGIGTLDNRRLTLEADGVQVHAVFRTVDETHERQRLSDGSYYQRLRDYAGCEIVAYQLSLLLAMDNVPLAVPRRINGEHGSMQIWLANAMMEEERVDKGLRSPDAIGWSRQMQEVLLFDELIANVDRNPGNLLIDANWRVWLIDHTRAFQQADKLRNPEKIRMVRRAFWEAMQALDPEQVRAVSADEIDGRVINALFERRDLLVAHLQGLIDERGEGAVIWE
jgi:hypothetical protein